MYLTIYIIGAIVTMVTFVVIDCRLNDYTFQSDNSSWEDMEDCVVTSFLVGVFWPLAWSLAIALGIIAKISDKRK